MSEANVVSIPHIEEVRRNAEEAEGHYAAMLKNCEASRAGLKMSGGSGETGAYQHQLDIFVERWTGVLQEFLDDEQKFVTFLGQLNVAVGQAKSLYLENEQRNVDTLTEIGKRLDELGG
jgi:hypothetical protein